MNYPFHVTTSERRIIGDLLAIAQRRSVLLPDPATAQSARMYIQILEHALFPELAALRERRVTLLQPLQAEAVRAHFDMTLESSVVTLNAKIRSGEELRSLVEKLRSFDFEAWQNHCDSERMHAD